MDDPIVARPALPSMDSEEAQHQLNIVLSIRACVLNKGFLGPEDGLIIASVSRSGFAVWWSFVKWMCTHRDGIASIV